MVDLQAALQEQLLDVAVAERVAQVPGDRLHDQRRLEVPALEVVLGPALQLERRWRSGSWAGSGIGGANAARMPNEP